MQLNTNQMHPYTQIHSQISPPHLPEVGTTGGQHHFVAGELAVLHQQSDVSEELVLVEELELLQHGDSVVCVYRPALSQIRHACVP